MDIESLRSLLEGVADGQTDVSSAMESLSRLPFAELGEAKVDHHRAARCGFPEVVFCQGKTPSQVRSIARELLSETDVFLATRADGSHYQAVAQVDEDARYFEQARIIMVDRRKRAAFARATSSSPPAEPPIRPSPKKPPSLPR